MLSYIIGGICIAVWLASIPRFHDPMFKSPVEGAVYYAKVAVALVRMHRAGSSPFFLLPRF